jgi:UDP-2,4-diacetamido-2,4,6-trideoxy-beta-L-altropyranose hydrolase
MRVVFRVDASLQIGIGNVMRCLTLAQVLKENGANVEFICRKHIRFN